MICFVLDVLIYTCLASAFAHSQVYTEMPLQPLDVLTVL